jgi:two-component system, OmpR family, sensor kinase
MPLRLRLTLITTVVLTVVLAVFGAGVYVLLDRNLRSRLDSTLEQRTNSIAGAMRVSPDVAVIRGLGFTPPNIYIQVVDIGGGIVARSEALGPEELRRPRRVLALGGGSGDGSITYDETVRGVKLRVRASTLTDQFGAPVGIVQIATPLTDVEDTLARLRGLLALSGLAGIALAAGLGWSAARTALRPVEEIGSTAHEIGATGDLSRRVASGRTDELGRLSEAFNTMLDRLQAAQAALSKTLETQRRFVDDASHELRTPLTIMRGNLELVARQPGMAGADRDAALRDAIEESERMSRLVDDLLALARVDAGMAMPDEIVDVASLVRDVGDSARASAGGRTVSVIIGAEDARVRGSEPLLRRLLENLTDNAIKYTAGDGTVSLSLVTDVSTVVVTVGDDGIGMAPTELAHSFDRFWRSDASRERPGSGLGLAIAKEVATAHGGSIEASSTPGEGTTFTVRLPASGEASARTQPTIPASIGDER